MTTTENRDAATMPCCLNCAFGRQVTVVTEDKKSGKETDRRNMCECHVARPTRFGFPVVRLDDFCSFHADPKTGERAYAGLVANVSTVV